MALKLGEGRKIVTTAATAVALVSSSLAVDYVIITAETGTVANTGYITVGDSSVIGADATRTGHPLAAGDSVTLYDVDLQEVYIDATVSTEGVTFVYGYSRVNQ